MVVGFLDSRGVPGFTMGSCIRDGFLDPGWIQGIHDGFLDSWYISEFKMGFWIQDEDSRWISGFTITFWIHKVVCFHVQWILEILKILGKRERIPSDFIKSGYYYYNI